MQGMTKQLELLWEMIIACRTAVSAWALSEVDSIKLDVAL